MPSVAASTSLLAWHHTYQYPPSLQSSTSRTSQEDGLVCDRGFGNSPLSSWKCWTSSLVGSHWRSTFKDEWMDERAHFQGFPNSQPRGSYHPRDFRPRHPPLPRHLQSLPHHQLLPHISLPHLSLLYNFPRPRQENGLTSLFLTTKNGPSRAPILFGRLRRSPLLHGLMTTH